VTKLNYLFDKPRQIGQYASDPLPGGWGQRQKPELPGCNPLLLSPPVTFNEFSKVDLPWILTVSSQPSSSKQLRLFCLIYVIYFTSAYGRLSECGDMSPL
jgi:hypothetical protein